MDSYKQVGYLLIFLDIFIIFVYSSVHQVDLFLQKMLQTLLYVVLLQQTCATNPNLPIFQSRSGTVQGRVEHVHHSAVDTFKGIPFAVPPVGSLRWTSPTREAKWSGTKIAESFGNACMQTTNAMVNYYPVNMSEDCLYLNVYRPHVYPKNTTASSTPSTSSTSSSTKPLPIMLFFYGGSYVYGAGSFIAYEASERIAQNPNVIIVTSNYRLQALGYMGGDIVKDQATNTTGNWGTLDQRAAMQWVAENAVALGGDPNKVTIFGESAGAGSVSVHMVSTGSWKYFHRAIMESGPIAASWITMPYADANKAVVQINALVGCNHTIECLRSVPAANIIAAGHHTSATSKGGDGLIDWSPVIDGTVLTDHPYSLLKAGKVHKVPVLLGSNRNEGTEFVKTQHVPDVPGYTAWAERLFGNVLAAKVLVKYPASNYTNPWTAATQAFGDEAMSCPARETARLLSDAGIPTYLYFLNQELKLITMFKPSYGVCHGMDLVYTFGKSIALWGDADEKMSAAFGEWWTTFADVGVPTSTVVGHSTEWTKYNRTEDNHMDMAVASVMGSGLKVKLCDFWAQNPLLKHRSLGASEELGSTLMELMTVYSKLKR